MTHAAGGTPVRRRRRDPVPPSPRRYTVAVDGRHVAELSIETGGDIVPGSVVVLADVSKIRGSARERAVADLVRRAGLDPKVDHERVYTAVFRPGD